MHTRKSPSVRIHRRLADRYLKGIGAGFSKARDRTLIGVPKYCFVRPPYFSWPGLVPSFRKGMGAEVWDVAVGRMVGDREWDLGGVGSEIGREIYKRYNIYMYNLYICVHNK